MIRQSITIINKLGLHARAASKLVNCASQFETTVTYSRDAANISLFRCQFAAVASRRTT